MLSRYLLLTLMCTGALTSFAQVPVQVKGDWPTMPNSPNYFELRQQILDHITDEITEAELLGMDAETDDDLRRFYRWDYLMSTRVDSAGNFPDPRILFIEWEKMRARYGDNFAGERAANWTPVGTDEIPTQGGGMGRINVVIIDPVDANTLYVGTAGGGLWRSTDLGGSWTPLTDNIPVLSIADVVVDPSNNDIIYIATGDSYGYEITWQPDNDFWGGIYAGGIMKSTDGGSTWLPTGLSYEQDELMIVQRMVMHRDDPNILIAATRNGIYRTTNGGTTWTLESSAHCYDIALHATDDNMFYAVGDRDVLVSSNSGDTWTVLEDNLSSGDDRMSIETTADNANVIYVLCSDGALKLSTDGGSTWANKDNADGDVSGFNGYWGLAMGVSQQDQDLVFVGGVDMARSTNGGNSFSNKTVWWDYGADNYVHADSKCILFDPTNDNIIYAANDGGLFKSTDKGNTWTDLSDGLRIAQLYRLSVHPSDDGLVLGGLQDNGTNFWNGSDWDRTLGGDGMEAIIDYTNPDRMYAEYYFGALQRSTNGGATWSDLPVAGGPWVTPYDMDPVDHLIMYYGTSSGDVQRSTNGGTSWITKEANLSGEVFDIAIAPSNTAYIYACCLQQIKKSTNSGDSWTNISTGLPFSGIGINYIAVSDENPEHLWVAMSGYSDGNKVFYSSNGGTTWTNVSGDLPNVPVNCIVYENVSPDDRIYIGTDIGVFTKSNTSDWEPYMTGLPNVMVHELEIDYTNYKIYAATFGRNVWRSDLYGFIVPTLTVGDIETTYCPGEEIDVDYVASGVYSGTNVFTAQLSSATGSFATPENIGSITSDALIGSIPATIPDDASGNGYRIRVTSSSPAVISIDNGADITIACDQPVGVETTTITATTATLDWDDVICAVSYEVKYKAIPDVDYTYVTTTSSDYTITDLLPNSGYEWAVRTICVEEPEVATGFTNTESFTTVQNSIIDIAGIQGFAMYPNPANSSTSVQFVLNTQAQVSVELLDITGKLVQSVAQGQLAPGQYQYAIDVDLLPAGTYSVMISVDDKSAATQLIVE